MAGMEHQLRRAGLESIQKGEQLGVHVGHTLQGEAAEARPARGEFVVVGAHARQGAPPRRVQQGALCRRSWVAKRLAVQRTAHDAHAGRARTRQDGRKYPGQRVRVAVAVEMRRMNAGLPERSELRVTLAAHLVGAHGPEERATTERSE